MFRPAALVSLAVPLTLLTSACSDHELGKFNSKPEASITSHSDGDEEYEGYAGTFRGSVSDPNHDNEDLARMSFKQAPVWASVSYP